MNRPKVVILGGGFGGLAAARALYKDADVTVVDRHNYHGNVKLYNPPKTSTPAFPPV